MEKKVSEYDMEENNLSINPNQLVPEAQPKVPQPNQADVSNNKIKEAPLLASALEKKDDVNESSINFQNSKETVQIQPEPNQNLLFNSATNSSNLLLQPYQNMELNLVKKIQQRGIRSRNANPNNSPIFTQQSILNNPNLGLRANLSNPNLNLISSINLNGNTNSNPNTSFFNPPVSMTKNTPTINPSTSQITSIAPSPVPKKEKNKEKKDKNKKVIKDKKEKSYTKKFHNKNKSNLDDDNDYVGWSRSNTRHNNSTGSERTVRRNTEQHQQTSGNPLDVWVMSAPFFKQLPTESDIEKVCGSNEQDMIDQNSENFLNDNESLTKCKHWSTSMKEVVINTLNALSSHNNSSKNQKNVQQADADQNSNRNNLNSSYGDYFFNAYRFKEKDPIKSLPQNYSEILYPPEPSPEAKDMSSFWLQNSKQFPVSDLQMQNHSIIDNILSAFVVAEPDKKHDEFLQKAMYEYESPFSLQRSPNTKNNENFDADEENSATEKGKENNYFLSTHVPAPQLEFDDYLSNSFEKRLELELESAGFKRPENHIHLSNPLAQEFEKYHKELKNLQPTINKFKQEVLANLPTYKAEEDRRKSEMQVYNNLLPKKHKK